MSRAATTANQGAGFVVTREYRRFAEFCDACRRYRYIGLCYGPPGVGKTLSARRYANWDLVAGYPVLADSRWNLLGGVAGSSTVLYTPKVVNAPGQIQHEVETLRQRLHRIGWDVACRHEQEQREGAAAKDDEETVRFFVEEDWLCGHPRRRRGPRAHEIRVAERYEQLRRKTPDPTSLILFDEADRLRIAGLEQARAIFDEGGTGLVLIGMPGLERRLARYPQLYSRVGFVHEFRPLRAEDVRELLDQRWVPPGVSLPQDAPMEADAVAAIVRITGGNFRLLDRLLTQTARLMEINDIQHVTRGVVEAARESLVIGSA